MGQPNGPIQPSIPYISQGSVHEL